jgi:hypothetical protein
VDLQRNNLHFSKSTIFSHTKPFKNKERRLEAKFENEFIKTLKDRIYFEIEPVFNKKGMLNIKF